MADSFYELPILGGLPLTESPDQTTVPPASQIVDASQNVWTIVSAAVAQNGVVDATTNSVVELAYVAHTVWHENTSANWLSLIHI